MPCTIERPIRSCVFQGSCPARPGSTNASAIAASAAGEGGSCRRGSMPQRSGLLLGVAALELLDAAGGVDDLLLAGVERVRFRRHLDLDHRVLLAVVPLHGLAALGVDRRAREEGMIRAGVEEDHRLVLWMDAWLHGSMPLKGRELYPSRGASSRRTPHWPWSPSACRSGVRPPRARPSERGACAAP